MVITGYKLNETALSKIEEELKGVRRKLEKITSKEYHRLLGEEVAFLCDNVALNILKRDERESIFDCAVRNLDKRIQVAGMLGTANAYNLRVFVHVMDLEGETYLKVLCNNETLLPAFKSLENYSLSETECQDNKNKKTITWTKLHSIYKDVEPLTINLTQYIKADKDKLVFPSLDERRATMARHTTTTHFLNQISGGEQIPPFLLMRYMDEAIKMLDTDEAKAMMKQKTLELSQILQDLDDKPEFLFENAASLALKAEPEETIIEEIKEDE